VSDRVTATEGIRVLLELRQLRHSPREEQLLTLLLAEYIELLNKTLDDAHAK